MNHKLGRLNGAWPFFLKKRMDEGLFILALTFAGFVLLSLASYHGADPVWFDMNHPRHPAQVIHNFGGLMGAFLADALYWSFGYVAYMLPLGLVHLFWVVLHGHSSLGLLDQRTFVLRTLGSCFFVLGASGLLTLLISDHGALSYGTGGLLGCGVALMGCELLNLHGTLLILFAMVLVGLTWLTGLSWLWCIEQLGFATLQVIALIRQAKFNLPRMPARAPVNEARPMLDKKDKKQKLKQAKIEQTTTHAPAEMVPRLGVSLAAVEPIMEVVPVFLDGLPELTLLDQAPPGKPMGGYTPDELERLSRDLEQHLLDFGIQVGVVAVHPGPVITRFELQLAAGVKASRLSALSKDLARSLSVLSVRVVEVIPGKTVVGLELPNPYRASVALSHVFSAEVYQQAHSPLTLALGVDIAGHPMVVDLAKMPHLLVAGTTGSGKSVGINAMILSLLFRATPEQVRLIMVDPKMLELSIYEGIPHLLTPVVTDMKEAASALRWCVEEMDRRYRLMAALGVRHLVGLNAKINEALAAGTSIVDPLWKPVHDMAESAPALITLPYIVVVIDELADMMMVVGKKVEQLIARIAQKARASGIHLILATQRPSVDVLTGLIKSNIPTRISFQVSSKIDSRTILDQQGAEQLLGYGDMLFLAPGTGAPIRVHGAFVDDQEVHRVVSDWRARGVPHYIDAIVADASDASATDELVEEADPLYDEAVAFVLQTRKASTSAVQRRFKIGYNRAARLVDEMERTRVVGPLEGGIREVMVQHEEPM